MIAAIVRRSSGLSDSAAAPMWVRQPTPRAACAQARLDDLHSQCAADAQLAKEVFPGGVSGRFLERMGYRMLSERVQLEDHLAHTVRRSQPSPHCSALLAMLSVATTASAGSALIGRWCWSFIPFAWPTREPFLMHQLGP